MDSPLVRFSRITIIASAVTLLIGARGTWAQDKVYTSGAMVIAPGLQPGSPTTGAHEVGELWVDSNGVLWICTGSGTPGSWDATNNLLGVSAAGMPAGVIIAYAGSMAPSGYLLCNGQAVSRSTYTALFNVIGTTYGAGDGSTTFNVPDLRGNFIRGLDSGRGVDTGRSLGSEQLDAFQGHYHGSVNAAPFVTGSGGRNVTAQGTGSVVWDHSATTGAPADDGAHGLPRTAAETRPRNVAVNFVIAY